MRIGPDPVTKDPSELDARADEEAHEKRYAEFVLNVVRWGYVHMLRCATNMYEIKPKPSAYLMELEHIVVDFAETEGWGAVFSAIARAIREHEDEITK